MFGSEGDASPPSIGEPWSPDVHCRDYRPPSGTHSPVDPKMTVRAYAGPMSPSKVKKINKNTSNFQTSFFTEYGQDAKSNI